MRTKVYVSARRHLKSFAIRRTRSLSHTTRISLRWSPDITKSYLGTSKKIDVQQTKGIQKVLVQSQQPFDAISMLRKRSISIDNKSSSYVFFENQEGFHFKTLEKLMESDTGDRVFTNDETIRTDIKKPIFRNLIDYEQPMQFSALDRIGGWSICRHAEVRL
jgi:hypothetical protein